MEQPSFALDRAIPSDVQYIEGIVAEVAAGCADFDFPRQLVSLNVRVALTEVLANAIMRGNREDIRKTVRILARVNREQCVVEVADEGRGFDYLTCLIDPTTPDRVQREDGRGLFLMHNLVDRVEQYNDDTGSNVVRITVRRP